MAKKQAAYDIPIGSIWTEINRVVPGVAPREARILAYVEGHVVARYKGGSVWVEGDSEFAHKHTKKSPSSSDSGKR